MENKGFLFTDQLTKRMLRLRFAHDKLFRTNKQPWLEFYNILLQNGFPSEMTVEQVRKKWSYAWDTYKIAKKEKNKSWKYYKIFEKHFQNTKVLDKYESWCNSWRLKLVICMLETKQHDFDHQTMWRTIERAMRSQDLPNDCCIQDMQGLWQYIKVTFLRNHRILLKRKSQSCDWPLYEYMLEYYEKHEPEQLQNMRSSKNTLDTSSKLESNTFNRKDIDGNEKNEFQWSKDITESFIQLRLQNDWLFCQRAQAWKDFVIILRQEHNFPNTLTSREAGRKWASMYREYQRAKATSNTSWLYYNLFELYLGEGSTSINLLQDWQEKWGLELIEARTSLENYFTKNPKMGLSHGWRKVEKRLRSNGIPLDHSLLNLPNVWSYLIKTYKWKKKFADKGVLKEQWPYFEAMGKYMEIKTLAKVKKLEQDQTKEEAMDFDDANDDYEDDLKLFELKQKMEVDLKLKYDLEGNQCRACAKAGGYVDIFEHNEDDGLDIASKLKIIGGIEMEKSDKLPTQICYGCFQELNNAYKFRQICQSVDKYFRDSFQNIKTEMSETVDDDAPTSVGDDDNATNAVIEDVDIKDRTDDGIHFDNITNTISSKTVPKTVKKELKKIKRYRKYEYWKMCEICGKYTKNLKSHVDAHNNAKPYSCVICNKSFKFKNGLLIHKAVHDPKPKKTCEVCGKTFHIVAHYKKHYVHHANERKYACETCGKRFNSTDILKVHVRIHTDERPFSCPECGKTFRTAGCVSRHKRIVHRITKKVQ